MCWYGSTNSCTSTVTHLGGDAEFVVVAEAAGDHICARGETKRETRRTRTRERQAEEGGERAIKVT